MEAGAATMYLGRRASSCASKIHHNFARTAEVGTILQQQDITWTLGYTLHTVSCHRVQDRRINNSSTLCGTRKTLEENFIKSAECRISLRSGQVTEARTLSTLRSVSFPELQFTVFSSPGISNSRKTISNIRLFVPGQFFGHNPELCAVRSSTNKILSRALSTVSKHKTQTQREQGEPSAEVNKVPPTTLSQGEDEKPEPEKVQSKTMQLKKVFKEYGAVGVSFHIGISLISLGIFYVALSSGIDMASVLCKMGFSESVVQSKLAAGTSTFVLAYAVHKLFAPVRISITLVSVPLIVRYLRKTGLFKPPRPSL